MYRPTFHANKNIRRNCGSHFPVFLAIFFLFSEAICQTPTPSPTPTPERPREIVALLNDARLAAPELAVDTFLKVVESKKIKDPQWLREILEEALRLTDDVKYPVRKHTARFSGVPVDTVAGYMTYAYDQKLDRLSLKARVIKDILPENKERARQLIFQINGDLRLKPLTCEDTLVYDVSDIYDTAARVLDQVFSQKEIDDGVRAPFLLPWVENIDSPAQIPAVSDMLFQWTGSQIEKQLLLNAFARAIDRKFNDDRSFTDLFDWQSNLLMRMYHEKDNPSLTPYLRGFLKKNTETRCVDHKPLNKDELPRPIGDANQMFPERPFVLEDFADVRYEGSPKIKVYLDSDANKRLMRLLRTSRAKKNLPENKNDKAAQIEWHLMVSEMLDLLDSWKAAGDETESEVFNQKVVFYRSLVQEASEPELKLNVTRAFMRFLAGAPMQKESFIEWLVHVKWVAIHDPARFKQMADEFPNTNFKVLNITLGMAWDYEIRKQKPVRQRGRNTQANRNDGLRGKGLG
jgi:hypothetical protein